MRRRLKREFFLRRLIAIGDMSHRMTAEVREGALAISEQRGGDQGYNKIADIIIGSPLTVSASLIVRTGPAIPRVKG